MGKILIITEKPSVARDYAKILGVSGRGDGFVQNDSYIITWCVGHLVEMSYPEKYDPRYKRWNLDDLPFLPRKYKYEVIPSVRKQYGVVHSLLNSSGVDSVLWAGDSGREGQVIEELIRMYGGVRSGIEERRVWIDSCTEEEVRRGIREARPYEDYRNLANAGIMRSIEDYCMGINFSRMLSVRYGQMVNRAASTKKYSAIAVGRVMTCVLGMVVRREREIRNFKETPFYRLKGLFSARDIVYGGEWKAVEGSDYFNSPKLYSPKGFKDRAGAEELKARLEELPGAVVEGVKNTQEKKKPPLLFNLAELQSECSKRFHISPKQTLEIAQKLYEGKMITYPRTDSRFLTRAVASQIDVNLKGLTRQEEIGSFAERILDEGLYRKLPSSQYVNDSKVTDHYAIIPTGEFRNLKGASSLEASVYDMIARRFLSVFYEPAVYQKTAIVTRAGNERFFTSVKALKSRGYYEVTGYDPDGKAREKAGKNGSKSSFQGGGTRAGTGGEGGEAEEILITPEMIEGLSALKKGTGAEIKSIEIKEGKTTPPKRYTTGSMILAMENAGQLIEDEELREQIKSAGIGTSATRAGIIEKLVRIGYLGLNKKNQVLTPQQLGEMVYEVVYMTIPSMLNPEMTASWEKGLSGVEKGEISPRTYQETLEKYVSRYVETVRLKDLSEPLKIRLETVKGELVNDIRRADKKSV